MRFKLGKFAHPVKILEHLHGLLFIDDCNGQTHVYEHVVTHFRFRYAKKGYLLDDAAEVDATRSKKGVILSDAENATRNG